MSERDAERSGAAWIPLDDGGYEQQWSRFEARYGFRASVALKGWPAIREPADSMTLDLSVIEEGPRWAAACDAINAEALRCFVWELQGVDELVVLDWQHQTYRFRPAAQAVSPRGEWALPVYPDGEYYAFLTPEMSEGTFGHPWEQTLFVIGDGSWRRSVIRFQPGCRSSESVGSACSRHRPVSRRPLFSWSTGVLSALAHAPMTPQLARRVARDRSNA